MWKKVKFVSFVSFVVPFFKFYISTGHPNTFWGSVFETPNIPWGSPFRIPNTDPHQVLGGFGSLAGWWQRKYFLCSIRTLGKSSNLTIAYFSNGLVKNHQLARVWVFYFILKHPPRYSSLGEMARERKFKRSGPKQIRFGSICRSHELRNHHVLFLALLPIAGNLSYVFVWWRCFVWTNLISSKLILVTLVLI